MFCYNKMFSSINKSFGCCSKNFGYSNKKFICCPKFCCCNKPFFPCIIISMESSRRDLFIDIVAWTIPRVNELFWNRILTRKTTNFRCYLGRNFFRCSSTIGFKFAFTTLCIWPKHNFSANNTVKTISCYGFESKTWDARNFDNLKVPVWITISMENDMVVDRFILKKNQKTKQITLSPCLTFIPKTGVGLPKSGVSFCCQHNRVCYVKSG